MYGTNTLWGQLSEPANWCGTPDSLADYRSSHHDLEKVTLSREANRLHPMYESVLCSEVGRSQSLPPKPAADGFQWLARPICDNRHSALIVGMQRFERMVEQVLSIGGAGLGIVDSPVHQKGCVLDSKPGAAGQKNAYGRRLHNADIVGCYRDRRALE